jgi:transcriptional regulator with XRE-family HTH domain
MDPVSSAFGRVLREQRVVLGLSQEATAAKADVDRTFISQLERGIRRATLTTLCKLAGALEISPSTLIARVEELLK